MLHRLFERRREDAAPQVPEPPAFTPAQERILDAAASWDKPESVLFFTTHKCASSFIEALFSRLLVDSPYDVVDYPSAIWGLGDNVQTGNPHTFLSANYDRLFRRRGVVYAPLRRPLEFPGIDAFRKVFFLRDPRDVVVSNFFSIAYSHPMPENSNHRANMAAYREEALELGIDAYTLHAAREFFESTYAAYREMHAADPNALLLTYDLFSEDTRSFLARLIEFLGIAPDPDVVEGLVELASPIQNDIDKNKHKRSGRSGQFVDELSPATIAELDEIFADDLAFLGKSPHA